MTPIILDPPPVDASTLLVPGIEAKHTWQPADGPPFEIGGVDAASRSTWPNFRIARIDGRHSKADAEDKRDLATARIGEIPRRSLKRGKTEAWSGLVRGRSLPELSQARSALLEAFAEEAEGTMTIHQPASYQPASDLTFTARVLSCQCTDEQTFGPTRLETGGWERQFTLGLRLSDPRYFEVTERTAQTSAFLNLGGFRTPFKLPFTIPGVSGAPSSMVVSNGGRAPAEPVFELHGPVADPWLVNEDVGAALYFKQGAIVLGVAQVMSIDFKARTIVVDGQPVSRDRIDWTLSNWWDAGVPGLKRGDQTVRYGGSQVTDPAFALARWRNPTYG